ncbi:hypothetical protein [Leucobacter massiliensis]|uniref:DUF4190 domain-containing protein n=1 Tax=Leucobacter massiliensis TaxID=1686285 RepID=A0A2S9QPH4_9MICO|nr:hypothetical protein [Leucobacter massiliensis]PRI11487.1 hypothetical protein B4915_06550 [Leucobacter massiliensis]
MSENLPGEQPASNPVPPAAPVPPATPGYGAAAAQPKKGLAITGMALGIAGLVLSWVPILGVVLALVGLVLSIVALVKKQPKGFALTGLITGAIGLIIGAFVTIAFFAVLGLGVDAAQACLDGAATVEIGGQVIDCSTVTG